MNIENYISSGIIEQYVMGLCSPSEANELISMRKQYAAINEAVIKHEKELEAYFIANNNSVVINTNTNNTILNSLKEVNANNTIKKPQLLNINYFKWVAAAAILLLAISTFFNYLLYKKNATQVASASKIVPQLSLPVANFNVLKNPNITPIAMMGQGYHAICRCTMFWDKSTGKAYVMIHHLISSGNAYDYQLWAIVNGKKISVGLIDDTVRNKFVEVNGMPTDASEFIVTLEKAGGALQPDEDVFLKGKV